MLTTTNHPPSLLVGGAAAAAAAAGAGGAACNIAMRRRESDTTSMEMDDDIDNSGFSWGSRGMSIMSDVSSYSCATSSINPAATTKQMHKSRLVIEKRGKLPNYSLSTSTTEEIAALSPTSPPSSEPAQRGAVDRRQLLRKDMGDSTRSMMSIQDLNMPFTQLQGFTVKTAEGGEVDVVTLDGDEEESDDEDDYDDDAPLSPLKNLKTLKRKTSTDSSYFTTTNNNHLGRSQSLHTTSAAASLMTSGNPAGLNLRNRSQSLHCLSSNMALQHAPPLSPVLNTRRRQSITKPLERALSLRTFTTATDKKDKKNTTTTTQQQPSDVQFTLKRRNTDGGLAESSTKWNSDNGAAMEGGGGRRRRSSALVVGDGGRRSSSTTQGGGAFSSALRESRRDQLNDILSNPNLRQRFNRSSLRDSFHHVTAVGANQKHLQSTIEAERDHRDSIFAKKEAKLMEAFNEGMTDFSSKSNGSKSPTKKAPRSSVRMGRHSISFLSSSLLIGSGGVGGGIGESPSSSIISSNVQNHHSYHGTTTLTGVGAPTKLMTPTKAYIVEYMKELRQEAAIPTTSSSRRRRRSQRSRRRSSAGNLIKQSSLRRSHSAPQTDAMRSGAVAAPADVNDDSTCSTITKQHDDTSTKGEAQIQALKALAGPSATRRATIAATLRRSSSIAAAMGASSAAAIPKSITVHKKRPSAGDIMANNDRSESSLPSLQSMTPANNNSNTNRRGNNNNNNNNNKLRMLLMGDMEDSLTSATSQMDDLMSSRAPSLLELTSTAA